MKKILSSLGILLLLLSSCLKDDMFNEQDGLDGASGGMAVLAVFNLVESSERLDVFLDNISINRGGEVLKYSDVIRHRMVFPGKRTLLTRVYYANREQVAEPREITLEQGKNYSLFLYGNNASEMILIEDDLILPQRGKFKVRFANFNRAQEAVDIGDKTESSKYFKATKPKHVTDFIELDVSEDGFLLSTGRSEATVLPIQLKPEDQGVYTVLITAPQIESNNESRRSFYKIIAHHHP